MSYLKILYIVALVICIVPVAFCEDTNDETWYDATCDEQFKDLEGGLKQALFAIVSIFVIGCVIATLVGHYAHKQTWFKFGIAGFGVLILVTVAYGLALGIFNYYTGKYW